MDRYGFTHRAGRYCLPGEEHRPGHGAAAAVAAADRFATLGELRRHLCAYGLPELRGGDARLSAEDAADLRRWVRYAHVSGLPDGTLVRPDDIPELGWARAFSRLKKLGLRYVGGEYECAGTGGAGGAAAGDAAAPAPAPPPRRFARPEGLQRHLARFGIPRRAEGPHRGGAALGSDERLELDLFLANAAVDPL